MPTVNEKSDSIFRAYDVRGKYPEEINEETAYEFGLALGRFLELKREAGNRQIMIGRDPRISSQALADNLAEGLLNRSFDVIDLGLISTPLLYFAIISEKAAGGVMITASHNPSNQNGFKPCRFEARPIAGSSGLLEIKELMKKEEEEDFSGNLGRLSGKKFLEKYLDFIKKSVDLKNLKPLKMVIDCSNGAIGPEISALANDLSGQLEILFAEPDGEFPGHQPNPLKEENLAILKEKVLAQKADLGVAFDGDGDRIIFTDEKGESVRGDFILALLAEEALKKKRGKIFYEVRSSRVVPEFIKERGGEPVLGRAGHSNIKEQMRKENIELGGELSGHYFFKETGFTDNALLTMLKVMKILSGKDKPFSEIISPFKKYFVSGEVNFEVKDSAEILERTEKKYSEGSIKKIDGLSAEFPDWWFNLRASNTEPLIRLNLEARTPEILAEKIAELQQFIHKNG